MVMPYCRFCLLYLFSIKQALARGFTLYHLARHVWHVGWAVILRTATLLERFELWVVALHRELTNGAPVCELGQMVKISTMKLGRIELIQRWYRHQYPLRFT